MASARFPMQKAYSGPPSDIGYEIVFQYFKRKDIECICAKDGVYVSGTFEPNTHVVDWSNSHSVTFDYDLYPLNSKDNALNRAIAAYLCKMQCRYVLSEYYLYVEKGTNMSGILGGLCA